MVLFDPGQDSPLDVAAADEDVEELEETTDWDVEVEDRVGEVLLDEPDKQLVPAEVLEDCAELLKLDVEPELVTLEPVALEVEPAATETAEEVEAEEELKLQAFVEGLYSQAMQAPPSEEVAESQAAAQALALVEVVVC